MDQWSLAATPNPGYQFAGWTWEQLPSADEEQDGDTVLSPAEGKEEPSPEEDGSETEPPEEDGSKEPPSTEEGGETEQPDPSAEDGGETEQSKQSAGEENPAPIYEQHAAPIAEDGAETRSALNVNWDPKANPLNVELSAETGNVVFTPHFVPMEMTLLDGNVANGTVNEGQSFTLSIPYSLPNEGTNTAISFRVYSNSGTLLASASEPAGPVTKGSKTCSIPLDSVSYLPGIVVEGTIKDANGERTTSKTYTLDMQRSVYNDAFAYVTSPSVGSLAIGQTGNTYPHLNGAYAEINPATGAVSLYPYGFEGVYTFASGGSTDLAALGALCKPSSNAREGAFAVGPDGSGGLIAAVEIDPEPIDKITTPGYDPINTSGDIKGQHFLYRWDGTSWIRIADSCFSAYTTYANGEFVASSPERPVPRGSGMSNAGLILSADDVWTNLYHWNGTVWAENEHQFVSFDREYAADGTQRYYGTDTDGQRWEYSGGRWISTSAAPDAPSTSSLNTDRYTVFTHQDHNGDWYTVMKPSWSSDDLPPSQVYKWSESENRWVFQIMTGFTDDNHVSQMCVPFSGITMMFDNREGGTIYMATADRTITFDANGGTLNGSSALTAPILSAIPSAQVPSATRSGYAFNGWFYDQAGQRPWNSAAELMPGMNITLYAKWTERTGGVISQDDPELVYHRDKALADLKNQFEKYVQSDYEAADWTRLVQYYNDGVAAINAAKPASGQFIENNIITELNKAIANMKSVTPTRTGKITVAMSMDASTLGLGYIIKPTLVTVDNLTQCSVATTDLMRDNNLAWRITGTIESAFYLAHVSPVDQTKYEIPEAIRQAVKTSIYPTINDDSADKWLGEFDYTQWSGWMYSISDGSEYPSFPGVGAADWQLSNGEVVRWQFTVYGYGADLNADNDAWGTNSLFSNLADKTSLTWQVATLRDQYTDDVLEANDTYNRAIELLTTVDVTQSDIDAIAKKLDAVDFTKQAEEEEEKPEPSGGGSTGSVATETKPEVTVDETGEATADLTEEDIDAVIEEAKAAGADVIVITPDVAGDADKVSVTLPMDSVSGIVQETDAALTVKTDIANVTVPAAGLADLAGTEGTSITISTEAVKDEDGNASGAVKVEVAIDGKAVEDLNGGLLITLPVAEEELSAGSVMVLVDAKGNETVIKKSALDETGITALLDGSCTVKVVNNAASFSDTTQHWASDAIDFVSSRELFQGTSEGIFAPNENMTRAMLATVLHRLENTAKTNVANVFGDVPAGTWYSDAIHWASENSIVNGYSASVFAPDDNISREQMATMLYRYAGFLGLDISERGDMDEFTDAGAVSDWASEAMEWAVSTGLMEGKGNGVLDPGGNATRAEVATILQRLVQRIVL